MPLNENVKFLQVPQGVQSAFVRRAGRRTLLPAKTELYKFTGYGLIPVTVDRTTGTVLGSVNALLTPWWAFVNPPVGSGDPGLDGHLQAAQQAGQSTVAYIRDKFAVMFGWNTLAKTESGFAQVLRIELTADVYGFYGLCQRMPNDAEGLRRQIGLPKGKPFLTGGAFQLWIPNLTPTSYRSLGTNLVP